VDAGVSGVSEFADQVDAGKMRVLAVSGEESIDVGGTQAPTIKDEGFDVVVTNWPGIVAPPGLSDAERDKVVAFVDEDRATVAPACELYAERRGATRSDAAEPMRELADARGVNQRAACSAERAKLTIRPTSAL
jgi:tripartite-type tricarboxylate transporter receptor subunit TctC